jgi:hypothetical protein
MDEKDEKAYEKLNKVIPKMAEGKSMTAAMNESGITKNGRTCTELMSPPSNKQAKEACEAEGLDIEYFARELRKLIEAKETKVVRKGRGKEEVVEIENLALKEKGLKILASVLGAENKVTSINNTQNNTLMTKEAKDALRAALARDDSGDEEGSR